MKQPFNASDFFSNYAFLLTIMLLVNDIVHWKIILTTLLVSFLSTLFLPFVWNRKVIEEDQKRFEALDEGIEELEKEMERKRKEMDGTESEL